MKYLKNKWISVKTKPNFLNAKERNRVSIEMNVFVYDLKRGVQRAKATLYTEDFDWFKKGDINFGNEHWTFLDVTHYMYDELPEPPKQN